MRVMSAGSGMSGMCLVLAMLAQGCAPSGCSDVGGNDGIAALIPRALFVASGSVDFKVCDADGCGSATEQLGPVPEGPVGRDVGVTFDDLGRDFEPGKVSVSVTLTDADGTVVATTEREVELTRYYPNGKECDGAGFVRGSLDLSRGDRV